MGCTPGEANGEITPQFPPGRCDGFHMSGLEANPIGLVEVLGPDIPSGDDIADGPV